jgi:hypothetical protein
MRSRKLVLLLPAVLCLCWGCVSWQTPVKPPAGILFTNYRAPLTSEVSDVPVVTKRGEGTVTYIQDVILTGGGIAWDDAAIQDAARRGNLTTVHYADYEVVSILGIFGTFKVIAYGD